MSRVFIGATVAAGNGSYATVYTVPASSNGFISNVIAYNSTGGSLNLTLAINRAGTDNVILAADAVSAGATNFYAKGASKPICPLVVLEGDIIKAQGSGSGITVTISGVRY